MVTAITPNNLTKTAEHPKIPEQKAELLLFFNETNIAVTIKKVTKGSR